MELPITLSADCRTRQVGNFTSPKLRSVQSPLTESISAIGAQALYEWATSSVDRQHATTLRVELRQMFREELAAFGHRIVFFLLRIAFPRSRPASSLPTV